MAKEFIVRKKIAIRAEPEEVWDALTNPEKTEQYFFHCKVSSKWKKGASITFKGRMFFIIKIELRGKILDIEEGKLLKYNLRNGSDKNGSISTVTDQLTYSKGITTLYVTDDVGPGEGADKRYKRSVKGWDKVLKGLKKLVEA